MTTVLPEPLHTDKPANATASPQGFTFRVVADRLVATDRAVIDELLLQLARLRGLAVVAPNVKTTNVGHEQP